MKKNSLFLCSAAMLLSVGALAGCGGGKTITVWVGTESTAFYQSIANEFVEANPDFGWKVKVSAADTGAAAGAMVQDNTSCADLLTIAHDNIGKLSQLSRIAPITNQELLAQIENDNPDSFKTVIKNKLGTADKVYTLAVPYISQALFLYYDTRYVSDTQAQTFEGLKAAAAALGNNVKGVGVTGVDGFNFSFTLLARNVTGGKNTSSLHLYEGGVRYDTFVQDNEEVAIAHWAQRYLADPNGLYFPDSSGWEVNVNNHKLLSVIGGAWHYNAFKNVVTDDSGVAHMGCAIIPTFSLTAEDVAGIDAVSYPADDQHAPQGTNAAPQVGDTYRGGSFVDCKCFVINMAATNNSDKYEKIQQLVKFFSTKENQQKSFVQATNVPAYAGADAYIESLSPSAGVDAELLLMAKAQTGMSIYGIAQPFLDGTLNTDYYSKSCPTYYKEMLINDDGSYTIAKSRETLFKMEYVYKHGKLPAEKKMPTSFPYATDALLDADK